MRKSLFAALVVVITGIFTSCTQGNSNNARYTMTGGKMGIVVMDVQTGEVYRMRMTKDGGSVWVQLGSPKDAK